MTFIQTVPEEQAEGAVAAMYELATVAAARRLRSSYCTLAHGSILLEKFLDGDELRAVVSDPHSAGLDAADVAVMDLADKVADDATSVTQDDIDRLRSRRAIAAHQGEGA
jgi:alkylhydroperoxidase family enzyme